MGPWWRIGRRNLGRNRRRTLLTAAALGLGYVAVVVLAGLSDGLTAQMIDNGTRLVSGQLQLHDADYLPDRDIHETIGGDRGSAVDRLLRIVSAEPGVEAAAPRVYGGGLVSSGASSAGALLIGVDPAREAGVSRLLSTVVSGRPPAPRTDEVMIGSEMARRLEVELGAELVVVAPAADGSLGNDLYRLTGIFETGLTELDGSYAVMAAGALARLLALGPDEVHEIAASLSDPWQAPAIAERLAARLSGDGADGAAIEPEPWTEYRPELVDYARLASASNWLIMALVFGMAIFGVANTMLMATFERRREFAVLMALGTTPPAIVRTVLYEALALGAVSLVAGAVLALPVMVWWHNAPPDLSWAYGDFTMAGALVRPVLRVEYDWSVAAWSAAALLLTATAAALYPAARAARVPPADALAGP